MIEVYFDGLCEPNPGGVATWGFVVRRGAKKLHEAQGLACAPKTSQCTNNVAEYMGVVKALEWLVAEKPAGPVVVRGDSSLVVNQLNGEFKVKSPLLAPLWRRASDLAAQLKSVTFAHIPREENVEADRLTNLAFAEYTGRGLPPPTTDVMTVDLVFGAPKEVVEAALRKARLRAQATALPGGTRVRCDLPLDPDALRPLLALKARLEGGA